MPTRWAFISQTPDLRFEVLGVVLRLTRSTGWPLKVPRNGFPLTIEGLPSVGINCKHRRASSVNIAKAGASEAARSMPPATAISLVSQEANCARYLDLSMRMAALHATHVRCPERPLPGRARRRGAPAAKARLQARRWGKPTAGARPTRLPDGPAAGACPRPGRARCRGAPARRVFPSKGRARRRGAPAAGPRPPAGARPPAAVRLSTVPNQFQTSSKPIPNPVPNPVPNRLTMVIL